MRMRPWLSSSKKSILITVQLCVKNKLKFKVTMKPKWTFAVYYKWFIHNPCDFVIFDLKKNYFHSPSQRHLYSEDVQQHKDWPIIHHLNEITAICKLQQIQSMLDGQNHSPPCSFEKPFHSDTCHSRIEKLSQFWFHVDFR